jgi:hypothetical protein
MDGQGRSWVRSPVVGGILGVFAGGLVILLVESAGHRLFGTAEPSDLTSVTGAMFGSVLFAWVAGSWVGGAVASYWSRARSVWPGTVVGLVLLAAAVSNMVAIPHPMWLMASAVILVPGAAIMAARRGRMRPAGGKA